MFVKEISKNNEDPRLSTVMSILSTSGGSFIVKLGNNDRTFVRPFTELSLFLHSTKL